jgi:hypothetical protein
MRRFSHLAVRRFRIDISFGVKKAYNIYTNTAAAVYFHHLINSLFYYYRCHILVVTHHSPTHTIVICFIINIIDALFISYSPIQKYI